MSRISLSAQEQAMLNALLATPDTAMLPIAGNRGRITGLPRDRNRPPSPENQISAVHLTTDIPSGQTYNRMGVTYVPPTSGMADPRVFITFYGNNLTPFTLTMVGSNFHTYDRGTGQLSPFNVSPSTAQYYDDFFADAYANRPGILRLGRIMESPMHVPLNRRQRNALEALSALSPELGGVDAHMVPVLGQERHNMTFAVQRGLGGSLLTRLDMDVDGRRVRSFTAPGDDGRSQVFISVNDSTSVTFVGGRLYQRHGDGLRLIDHEVSESTRAIYENAFRHTHAGLTLVSGTSDFRTFASGEGLTHTNLPLVPAAESLREADQPPPTPIHSQPPGKLVAPRL